jgi:hypothetical protein
MRFDEVVRITTNSSIIILFENHLCSSSGTSAVGCDRDAQYEHRDEDQRNANIIHSSTKLFSYWPKNNSTTRRPPIPADPRFPRFSVCISS